MAKIDLPKRSGKRSKVSEKSGNFENLIEWQPCSNYHLGGVSLDILLEIQFYCDRKAEL